MIKVYGIKTCGSYKKAVSYFKSHNIDITSFDLKEIVPSKEEFKRLHELSKLDIKKFFNTSGQLYRNLDMKNKYKEMSLDSIYELLSKNGMLIKRPLVIKDDIVIVGFNLKQYNKIFI